VLTYSSVTFFSLFVFFLLLSILNFGLKNVIFVSYVDEQRRSSPYGNMGQLPHLPVEENTIPIEF